MDDSVHEALAFNEEMEQDQSAGRKTALNALFATALAVLWFSLTQWGKGAPAWVFLCIVIISAGVGLWVGFKKREVRAGYRQNPFDQPQPDKKYYFGFFLLFAPTFFQTFLEGYMVVAAIVFTLWGVGVFWALNSGAMDMSTRDREDDKQASGDE
ncbi:hypothetical protein [Corynebacterium sp. p3-SID1241]|uniref:hypothetical protein n=1 Tax=Corynebacterium sp. p3-SID1241 TaxID=2916102 RepID=UPI0021A5CC22|nr:hypothetical protein [Corynebacterium sp. p3-SID1241]MCT1427412.1 hypothetical protein [Corynebacterium sp. p3-SID1241]